MSSALEKATILIEALPYIQVFHGKTVVVKYGGNAMINEELKEAVINDIILMRLVGMRPVIVHGGGPEINAMLEKMQIKSQFVNGLRVTDEATMEVVEMVLNGKINTNIVSQVNHGGGKAVGLCGKDGNLFTCEKVVNQDDLGFVGSIKEVNVQLLLSLMDEGYIPVISPVGGGADGHSYNTNADYAAGKIAQALRAEKLVLLTDVEGIFADPNTRQNLISVLPASKVPSLIEAGTLAGGMIPKVKCCVESLGNGVTSAHILDGRQPHSILLEIFTKKGIGTQIIAD
ncbi:MAG: acetylglutamate kinase [Clostridiales bacterium]